ncbi:MAG: hypothetical protein AAGF11_29505 [Myxococcota bacterium]
MLLSVSGCVQEPETSVLPLPFTVSDYYAPSGFMGDGSFADRDAIVLAIDDDRCGPRPKDARGSCYRFEYSPLDDGMGWGGVYWQSPPGNWGTEPGRPIAPGAAQTSFWAWSEPAGVPMSVFVGGMMGTDQNGEPHPFTDTFRADLDIMLNAEPTSYAIEFEQDPTYDEILGGFGWSITAGDVDGPVVVYIDNVRWED